MPRNLLDDLLDETDFGPKLPTLERINPVAVVMATIVTTCKCGCKYEHPNRHVMLRYGNTLKWCGTPDSLYLDLPREFVKVPEQSPFCSACFKAEKEITGDYKFGGKE